MTPKIPESTTSITPCLWFNDNAQEAAKYYITVFDNSEITQSDTMMTWFKLGRQKVGLINGGPMFPQSESFSFFVTCQGQEEVDRYWDRLVGDGGQEGQCGWCKDKFGVSWQIIPKQLGKALANPDPAKAKTAMEAMIKMKKIIVADLEQV